jgi:hypothetical protein
MRQWSWWERFLERLARAPRGAWSARARRRPLPVDGAPYPGFHPGYANHPEELFFHTSRYYAQTEQFLRRLSGDQRFSLAGYRAARLSRNQRRVLACLLSEPPSTANARAIVAIASAVRRGERRVDEALLNRYRAALCSREADMLAPPTPPRTRGGAARPVEAFFHLARRLGIPVRASGRIVRASFPVLARHLDSRNPTIRCNLQTAILDLHRSGYRLTKMHHC